MALTLLALLIVGGIVLKGMTADERVQAARRLLEFVTRIRCAHDRQGDLPMGVLERGIGSFVEALSRQALARPTPSGQPAGPCVNP